jgi:hypothetical protein
MKRGRNDELINLRSRTLVARYYYWVEIWEKSYNWTIKTLSKGEFFISELTIQRELTKFENYLLELRKAKPSIKELQKLYPGFCWQETLKVQNKKHLTV